MNELLYVVLEESFNILKQMGNQKISFDGIIHPIILKNNNFIEIDNALREDKELS